MKKKEFFWKIFMFSISSNFLLCSDVFTLLGPSFKKIHVVAHTFIHWASLKVDQFSRWLRSINALYLKDARGGSHLFLDPLKVSKNRWLRFLSSTKSTT